MTPRMMRVWHTLRRQLDFRYANWARKLEKENSAELQVIYKLKMDSLERRIWQITHLLDRFTRCG